MLAGDDKLSFAARSARQSQETQCRPSTDARDLRGSAALRESFFEAKRNIDMKRSTGPSL